MLNAPRSMLLPETPCDAAFELCKVIIEEEYSGVGCKGERGRVDGDRQLMAMKSMAAIVVRS